LGYQITTPGIRSLTSKLEAIQQLKPHKTLKQLRPLFGLIYYYRDMWKQRSHILTPLTELTKVLRGSKLFEIHTEASDYQLGSVISQNKKPFAFYSKKLTAAQPNYTVGEREMLSTVKTLNDFCAMLLGHKLKNIH